MSKEKKIEQLREQIRRLQEKHFNKERDIESDDNDAILEEQLQIYKACRKGSSIEFVYLDSLRKSIVSPIILYKRLNEYGEYFHKEKIYIDRIGEVELNDSKVELEGIKKYLRIKDEKGIRLDKCLFLDIETTGLESGCGNIAYIIGLGYFDGASFIVKQYFLRDFDEEHALLTSVNEYTNKYDYIITYNGKRFDMNILRNRYLLNRLPFGLDDLNHIDVLTILRELFNKSGKKLSLSLIEKELIGIERNDDIASYLIPEAYYRYLNQGYSELLDYVFEHNAQDIASLAGLTLYLNNSFIEPEKEPKISAEINYYLGRCALRVGDLPEAKRYYEIALNYELNNKIVSRLVKDLCSIYSKEGDCDKIIKLLTYVYEKMPEAINASQLKKIAIYYEKHEKDLDRAFYYAIKYQEKIEKLDSKDDKFIKSLFKRMLKHINRI